MEGTSIARATHFPVGTHYTRSPLFHITPSATLRRNVGDVDKNKRSGRVPRNRIIIGGLLCNHSGRPSRPVRRLSPSFTVTIAPLARSLPCIQTLQTYKARALTHPFPPSGDNVNDRRLRFLFLQFTRTRPILTWRSCRAARCKRSRSDPASSSRANRRWRIRGSSRTCNGSIRTNV